MNRVIDQIYLETKKLFVAREIHERDERKQEIIFQVFRDFLLFCGQKISFKYFSSEKLSKNPRLFLIYPIKNAIILAEVKRFSNKKFSGVIL